MRVYQSQAPPVVIMAFGRVCPSQGALRFPLWRFWHGQTGTFEPYKKKNTHFQGRPAVGPEIAPTDHHQVGFHDLQVWQSVPVLAGGWRRLAQAGKVYRRVCSPPRPARPLLLPSLLSLSLRGTLLSFRPASLTRATSMLESLCIRKAYV